MGEVLTMADQRQGCDLTDRGTYIACNSKFDLKVLTGGDRASSTPTASSR